MMPSVVTGPLLKMPFKMLPEITLPAPAAAPPMVVFVRTPPPDVETLMPDRLFGSATFPAASVPM
jgi:hypothetical protein